MELHWPRMQNLISEVVFISDRETTACSGQLSLTSSAGQCGLLGGGIVRPSGAISSLNFIINNQSINHFNSGKTHKIHGQTTQQT